MFKSKSLAFGMMILSLTPALQAVADQGASKAKDKAPIDRAEKVSTHASSSGDRPQELCVAMAKIPGGDYSNKDEKKEAHFCEIEFYDSSAGPAKVALCPKYLSTSAAVMIYDIQDTKYNPNNQTAADYELAHCGSKKGVKKVAKFKPTMNQPATMDQPGTSALFSAASPLYYHLSRYLDTQVQVPVAVYRTMDKSQLSQRVIEPAFARNLIPHSRNHTAWSRLRDAIANPADYNARKETFTDDLKQVFGTLVKDFGERYGEEFNGLAVNNGYPSAESFANNVAFQALRSEQPLKAAIQKSITSVMSDPKHRDALGGNVSETQVAFWMRDVTEIALLDFIMSQQDRNGNIDFEWQWVYKTPKADGSGFETVLRDVDDEFSDLPRDRMSRIQVPADIANFQPELIQRTILGDNDAGGKVQYGNVAKRNNWLAQFKHFPLKTYKRLQNLNKDFAAKGPVYQYLVENFQNKNFKISSAEVNQIFNNTKLAADQLRAQCSSGAMKLDLSPKSFYETSGLMPHSQSYDCMNP